MCCFKQGGVGIRTIKLEEKRSRELVIAVLNLKHSINFLDLATALPEEGSIKSAKYPAAVNLEQISLALSLMNYK